MQDTIRNIIRPIRAWTALALVACAPAQASVVMNGTRFVYNADAKEITVKVSNVGKLPALTQAWIDDGDEKSTPEHVDVPFNLTPPIARVDPGKAQTLRIAFTGGNLPADRESLFWLNILEVPPKPEDSGEVNRMQLAFRYRLKLFYRPKGLSGDASTSPEKLEWKRTADGGLLVSNPTAFSVTLNDVKLKVGGNESEMEPFALAPFATVQPKPASPIAQGAAIEVRYQSINDYGGFVSHDKKVAAP